MTIIYINNNDAIINNYYGRLQDLIFLFIITIDMRKIFFSFEIYRQFELAPSESFASPVLGSTAIIFSMTDCSACMVSVRAALFC